MSMNRDEERRVCDECHADAPEESLCAYCQFHLAGDRAGRALLDIAIASGEWDGHPDGLVEVDLVDLGHFVIAALITPGRCPEELAQALEYAGFTRRSGIAYLAAEEREEREERIAAAVEKTVACCPDDLGHVPGPGSPI